MTSLTLSAVLAIVALFVFFLIGAHHFRQIDTYDAFFLRRRNLRQNEYASSFGASSASLATAIMWFITFSPSEGLAIVWAPITYVLGALVFMLLAPALDRHKFFAEGRTLGAYMHRLYRSRSVAMSISVIAVVGLLCILLIELYIGATIFAIYTANDVPYAVPISVAVITIAVFCYSALGGFPGVVRNDKVQVSLIVLLAVAAPIILLAAPPTATPITASHWLPGELLSFAAENPLIDGRFIVALPLFVNLLFVNVLLFPAQLRNWQMAAASESSEAMQRGLVKGGILTLSLWSAFIVIGILIGVHYGTDDFNAILTNLAQEESPLLSYVLFPLLLVAALAALLSTADSAIIPIAQTMTDDYVPVRYRTLGVSRLVILGMLAVALVLYYVVFMLLGITFFHLLFTLFGILIILAPAVLFAVLFHERTENRHAWKFALGSIWVGFGITMLLSYLAQDLAVVMYAGPIGVSVGAVIMALAFLAPRETLYGKGPPS